MKFPKSFCWYPFMGIHVSPPDDIKPCCKFVGAANSQEIRDAILSDRWHPGCKSCKQIEDAGYQKSLRKQYVGPRNINAVLENKQDIQRIELSIDNLCNLACVTCQEGSSSRWIAENKRMYGKSSTISSIADDLLYSLDWSNITHCVIYGGEPLYSKNTLKLLSWLIASGFSRNIDLNFYTNGTIGDPKALALFEDFRNVDIGVSIDGVGKRFEFIRWPAVWEDVKANFEKLTAVLDTPPHIIYTFSILNATHTLEDFRELRQLTNRIHPNLVSEPRHFAARHLPDSIKNTLLKEFKDDEVARQFIPELAAQGDPALLEQCRIRLAELGSFRNLDLSVLGDVFC
jgi:Radical SAM superfamily/4Fe-4S single cluster domain